MFCFFNASAKVIKKSSAPVFTETVEKPGSRCMAKIEGTLHVQRPKGIAVVVEHTQKKETRLFSDLKNFFLKRLTVSFHPPPQETHHHHLPAAPEYEAETI